MNTLPFSHQSPSVVVPIPTLVSRLPLTPVMLPGLTIILKDLRFRTNRRSVREIVANGALRESADVRIVAAVAVREPRLADEGAGCCRWYPRRRRHNDQNRNCYYCSCCSSRRSAEKGELPEAGAGAEAGDEVRRP